MKNVRIHVLANGNRWSVLREGASRASKKFDSQAGAVEYARSKLAVQNDNSFLYVHRKDGSVSARYAK